MTAMKVPLLDDQYRNRKEPLLPENSLVLVVCGGVIPLGGDPTVKTTGEGLAEPPSLAPVCRFPPWAAEGATEQRK